MSDTRKSKFPNMITYIRNVIEPYIAGIKVMFSATNKKISELEKRIEELEK